MPNFAKLSNHFVKSGSGKNGVISENSIKRQMNENSGSRNSVGVLVFLLL